MSDRQVWAYYKRTGHMPPHAPDGGPWYTLDARWQGYKAYLKDKFGRQRKKRQGGFLNLP